MAELPGPSLVNDPILRQRYWDYTDAGTLDVLSKTFDETLHYNPLNAGARAFDYFVNKDKGRKYTKQEWSESAYYREGITVGDDGIHEGAASLLAEDYDERLRRNIVLNRAKSSFSLGAAQLGVGLVGSALDPLNIASAFVPVMGQARFASLAARYGTTRARAIRGAAEGAVGAALVEPIVLTAAELTQDKDYTLMDSLLNITFGTALGGGLHAVGGKLADKLSRTSPQTREVLTRTAVAQMADTGRVDVEPIQRADPTLRELPPDSLGPAAQAREDFMIEAKGKRIPDILRPALVEGERPKTLLQFIRAKGGINTKDKNIGDVKTIMDKKFQSIARKGGKTLDELAELASDAGYISSKGEYGPDRATINDLLDAIAEENFGNKVYSKDDLDRIEAMERAEELFDEARGMDIDPKGLTDNEFLALLNERRGRYERLDDVPENLSYKVFKEGMTEEEFAAFKEEQLGKTYELGELRDDYINEASIEQDAAAYRDPEFDAIQQELAGLEEQIATLREIDEVPQEFLDNIAEADEIIERANSFDAAMDAAAVCIGRAVRPS